jgi:NAD-dependent deacetylase
MAKVIILSGAGISAESGISTFRDEDGLWENHNIEDICTSGCLDFNRENTIKFYDMLRVNLKDKQPNHAHKVVAQLKNKYPYDIAVITQNVDDMFERAGCKNILHLHGFLQELRCEKCNTILNIQYEEQFEKHENCPNCNTPLRPNIVFFGENAPKYEDMYKEFDDCEVFLVIGTSGAVIYTDMFLNPQIKLSILNNLQESPFINDTVYSKVLYKKATLAIDEIASDIEEYLISYINILD